MLKVLTIITTIIVIPVVAFFYYRSGATIAGTIIDCQTGQNVGVAMIRTRQVGWGFNPNLIWDKFYDATTLSDVSGYFSVRVSIRKSAEIKVTKDNYLDAIEYRLPGSQENLRILAGDPNVLQKPPAYIVYTRDCVVQ